MKFPLSLLIIPIVMLCSTTGLAAIHNLGSYGHTYAIAEPDALTQIKEAARKVDWSKVFSRKAQEDRIKHFRPRDLVNLPRAERDRTYLVDLTFVLPFDIPDGKGGVLYPKGYTINPLDYITYPRTLVVIDGSDPKQVRWFTHSEYANSLNTTLLITNGSYYDLAKRLNRPVFYLMEDLAERLKIETVPSVISQKGRYMEVREIAIQTGVTARLSAGQAGK
ncbi:MAG: hypothetical protein JRJ75_13745 [Deltaproteobacteria bacterium]|nr:hypothetical protein [Deltaproteobacteria bacterium]